MLISSLIVPFSRLVWFIRLFLAVVTHAHILHAGFHHVAHRLPGDHRIRRMVHTRCRGDWDGSGPGYDPPVYCIRVASVHYVRYARLESCNGFDGDVVQRFDGWRIGLLNPCLRSLLLLSLISWSDANICPRESAFTLSTTSWLMFLSISPAPQSFSIAHFPSYWTSYPCAFKLFSQFALATWTFLSIWKKNWRSGLHLFAA